MLGGLLSFSALLVKSSIWEISKENLKIDKVFFLIM